MVTRVPDEAPPPLEFASTVLEQDNINLEENHERHG